MRQGRYKEGGGAKPAAKLPESVPSATSPPARTRVPGATQGGVEWGGGAKPPAEVPPTTQALPSVTVFGGEEYVVHWNMTKSHDWRPSSTFLRLRWSQQPRATFPLDRWA